MTADIMFVHTLAVEDMTPDICRFDCLGICQVAVLPDLMHWSCHSAAVSKEQAACRLQAHIPIAVGLTYTSCVCRASHCCNALSEMKQGGLQCLSTLCMTCDAAWSVQRLADRDRCIYGL